MQASVNYIVLTNDYQIRLLAMILSVLKVSRQSLAHKSRHIMFSAYFENDWSHNCLSRARMVILIIPSDLVEHFTYSKIVKLLKSSNIQFF